MTMRYPGEMEPHRVAILDFDGTIVNIQEPSPSGMNVDNASRLAVEEIIPEALPLYKRQGGLQNRAAIELIRDLLPDATPVEQAEICERYNKVKFGHTMSEVGTHFPNRDIWPRLVPGFRDFHEWQMEDPYLTEIMISSSNREGVLPILAAHKVKIPHILETDAVTCHVKQRGLDRIPVKPSPLLVEFAFEDFCRAANIDLSIAGVALRANTAIIGDGMAQDGEMARLSGLDFFWVRKHTDAQKYAYAWRQLQYRLTNYVHPLQFTTWSNPAQLDWPTGDNTFSYQAPDDDIRLHSSTVARV